MSLQMTIITGTNRPNNMSQRVAKFLVTLAEDMDDVVVKSIKPADFDLSVDGNDEENKSKEYTEIVNNTDAFVIVAPEYNHSFPGSLKSLLDKELKAYNHRAVGLVGVSSGMFAGARVVESLLPVMRELGLTLSHTSLHIPKAGETFDESGSTDDEGTAKHAQKFLDELIWVSKSLKWGRENLS